jgi:membrane protein
MGETYGSFAAVVTLMLWFFLTAFVILLGAEINSECEHQTARDTTIGPEQPMGERGATFADQVATEETWETYVDDEDTEESASSNSGKTDPSA